MGGLSQAVSAHVHILLPCHGATCFFTRYEEGVHVGGLSQAVSAHVHDTPPVHGATLFLPCTEGWGACGPSHPRAFQIGNSHGRGV